MTSEESRKNSTAGPEIIIHLSAVILCVEENELRVLLLPNRDEGHPGLPSGLFYPSRHRTLEEGLRANVRSQTGGEMGYVEQLYTFGNRFREKTLEEKGQHLLTISYLALTRGQSFYPESPARWENLYSFFPWEDYREGIPECMPELLQGLDAWAKEAEAEEEREDRLYRIHVAFGDSRRDEEKVLPRYELLYEAGLVAEAYRDWNSWTEAERPELPISRKGLDQYPKHSNVDASLVADHRRILASALGRLRGKIKYRPLVFELLPPVFTLLQIQRVAEAIGGKRLHKSNFRRLLLNEGFIKNTGQTRKTGSGRPAALYRFRKRIITERPSVGIPLSRN